MNQKRLLFSISLLILTSMMFGACTPAAAPATSAPKPETPIPAQPLPPVCSGLLAQIKSYEILTAAAAMSGDRNIAYQALLANPLGSQADQVEAVLDVLLKTNKHYLPQFWHNSASTR